MGQFIRERESGAYRTTLVGMVAGAAGGIAEILWVGIYGGVTGVDTTAVARSISTVASAVLPVSPFIDAPITAGIVIHLLAAAGLGAALAFAWRALLLRNLVGEDEYRLLPAALAMIWVFNFFVLLPLISPYFAGLHRTFTEIVPYPVSLFSKLLFGIAAAAVFTRKTRAQSVTIGI